jgi:hypothetical protein
MLYNNVEVANALTARGLLVGGTDEENHKQICYFYCVYIYPAAPSLVSYPHNILTFIHPNVLYVRDFRVPIYWATRRVLVILYLSVQQKSTTL